MIDDEIPGQPIEPAPDRTSGGLSIRETVEKMRDLPTSGRVDLIAPMPPYDRFLLLSQLPQEAQVALVYRLDSLGLLHPGELHDYREWSKTHRVEAPPPAVIPGDDLTLHDLVAFVVGAAVALVHLRPQFQDRLQGGAWLLLGPIFLVCSVTAAGPFVLGLRRWGRRLLGRPGLGDLLWALLGLPWVLFAPFAQAGGRSAEIGLSWLVTLACMIALVLVAWKWSNVSPERASLTAGPPWTNRLGLFLAVAWPFQCASCLAVLSG